MTNHFQLTPGQRAELNWLRKNPHFVMRPASIREFIGPGYLDEAQTIRPGLMKTLVGIFGEEVDPHWISMKRRAVMTGAIGIGKGQVSTDLVSTPKGWRQIGTLQAGDLVHGSDGNPTEVTGVYPRGELDVFRVSFTDGTSLVVDGDHLWNVQSPSMKMRSGKFHTYDTRTLIKLGVKTDRGQRKWHIPVVDPVQFEGEDDYILPPYSLGALLGDGGLTQASPNFTTEDDEILHELSIEIKTSLGVSCRQKDHNTWCFSNGYTGGTENPLTRELRRLGVWGKAAHEKSIPPEYMRYSVEARKQLLRGLMDTDGWHNPKVKYTEFCTVSKQLAEGVAELVRSLGGIAKIKTKETGYRLAYLVSIKTAFNPFQVERKKYAWSPAEKYRPTKMIDSIEPAGTGEVVCISVAAADKLYVARDYTVTHNTTFASIVLPYMVHWVSCLKDPQGYFKLMKGSRIAFMMMSTTEKQARQVLFDDIKGRVNNSDWFKAHCKYDPKWDTQLRFPKDIWIVPGNSEETTFEGYNILGGVIDEGDSHKVTEKKDYAEAGWDTIISRIDSRFNDPIAEKNKGLLIAIGQMKSANGFMAKKYKQLLEDPDGHAVRMSIWESKGWYNYTEDKQDIQRCRETSPRRSFFFDVRRKVAIPKSEAVNVTDDMIEIPIAYAAAFANDPLKALRDLAGIPPETDDPFISQTDRILLCQQRWTDIYGDRVPVDESSHAPKLADWVRCTDSLKRVVHIDIAYSAKGDALGLAMGHVPELVDIDGEEKPLIAFDLLYRVRAAPGTEVQLSDIRRLIYDLIERGFNIKYVSLDGFNSKDTIQQLTKRKIRSEYVSVDRTKAPYEDLRDAINDMRVAIPKYMTYLKKGDLETVDIAYKELAELTDTGKKIDHPPLGSKDVADAMAGVVYKLMNDSSLRRGARKPSQARITEDNDFDAEAWMRSVQRATTPDQYDVMNPPSYEDFLKRQQQFLAPAKIPSVSFDPEFPTMMPGTSPPVY